MPVPRKTSSACPVELTISVIAARWKARIVYQLLLSQPRSYGELRGLIEGITDRVLTQQLCELKDDGVLTSQREGRLVRYCLTDSGRSLIVIFQAMLVWGEARQAELSGTGLTDETAAASEIQVG